MKEEKKNPRRVCMIQMFLAQLENDGISEDEEFRGRSKYSSPGDVVTPPKIISENNKHII
jgi:hypothetical protein